MTSSLYLSFRLIAVMCNASRSRYLIIINVRFIFSYCYALQGVYKISMLGYQREIEKGYLCRISKAGEQKLVVTKSYIGPNERRRKKK